MLCGVLFTACVWNDVFLCGVATTKRAGCPARFVVFYYAISSWVP